MKRFLIAAFCLFVSNIPLYAAEPSSSLWVHSHNTSMRLIAGASKPNETLHAGLEIRLAPGFKTYWRTPGESGVAPVASFEGSQNLKKAEVLFPAPQIFKEKSGTVIGYKDSIVWPIHVEAQDAAKPVLLNIKLDYGVCEKICVPASGTATISLTSAKETEFDAKIKSAEARVPQKMKLGEGKDVSITKVSSPIIENGHATFLVDVAGSQFLDVLPEARSDGLKPESWYLEAQAMNNIGNQFKITVFDPQSGQSRVPCNIVLTAMNQSKAIEVSVRLAKCVEHP